MIERNNIGSLSYKNVIAIIEMDEQAFNKTGATASATCFRELKNNYLV
jgi:hypothetical protein